MFPPAPERTLSSGRPGCARGCFMRAGRPGPASFVYSFVTVYRSGGGGSALVRLLASPNSTKC
eukprot:4579780-Pyramimonas_sp.AAC.1